MTTMYWCSLDCDRCGTVFDIQTPDVVTSERPWAYCPTCQHLCRHKAQWPALPSGHGSNADSLDGIRPMLMRDAKLLDDAATEILAKLRDLQAVASAVADVSREVSSRHILHGDDLTTSVLTHGTLYWVFSGRRRDIDDDVPPVPCMWYAGNEKFYEVHAEGDYYEGSQYTIEEVVACVPVDLPRLPPWMFAAYKERALARKR